MGFFDRRRSGEDSQADNIILNAGRITDEALLDTFTKGAAFSAAFRRHEASLLEKYFPGCGYREELNKQRSAAGLPPI
jgi:hypothetical protein